jgi:hypothetical protein
MAVLSHYCLWLNNGSFPHFANSLPAIFAPKAPAALWRALWWILRMGLRHAHLKLTIWRAVRYRSQKEAAGAWITNILKRVEGLHLVSTPSFSHFLRARTWPYHSLFACSIWLQTNNPIISTRPSQRTRCLRNELPSSAQKPWSWIWNLIEASMSVVYIVCVVLCVGTGLVTGWSRCRRSPTD